MSYYSQNLNNLITKVRRNYIAKSSISNRLAKVIWNLTIISRAPVCAFNLTIIDPWHSSCMDATKLLIVICIIMQMPSTSPLNAALPSLSEELKHSGQLENFAPGHCS